MIASSVQQAAHGAGELAGNMAVVTKAINETNRAATEVLDASQAFSAEANTLEPCGGCLSQARDRRLIATIDWRPTCCSLDFTREPLCSGPPAPASWPRPLSRSPPIRRRERPADDDAQIAKSLATMLRAGRTVVSRHQDSINDANLGNKGFDSKTVLAEAIKIYQDAAGTDPMAIDPNSRHGKLIRMQMAAIAEVIDAHQETINRKGVGFKGFIPAVFGRLTNEAVRPPRRGPCRDEGHRAAQFIRNAKAKADDWESGVIRDKLMTASGRRISRSPPWPRPRARPPIARRCRNIMAPPA